VGGALASITYTGLQQTLQAIIARTPYPYAVTDGAFSVLFPQAISYAEGYIYNKLPMLAQRAQDTSLVTTPGAANVSLAGTLLPILVPERIALLTPAGSSMANGTQVQFVAASSDLIDSFWPNESLTWAPNLANAAYWCIQGGVSPVDFSSPIVTLAPTPDAAYTVVLTGLFQQAPLSAANPQTYLSTLYAPLLTAACMVFISGGLLRNYGAQTDETGMAVSWQGQTDRLLDAAGAEEMRRRSQGTGFLDRPPMGAMPPRPPQPAGAA
jgi:hypothetical protein